MKKSVLCLALFGLGLCGQVSAHDYFSPYAGTTEDDFQEGGQFDLGTPEGLVNFRQHNGMLSNEEKKAYSRIKNIEREMVQIKQNLEKLTQDQNFLTEDIVSKAQLAMSVYDSGSVPSGWEKVIDSNSLEFGFQKRIDRLMNGSTVAEIQTMRELLSGLYSALYRTPEGKYVLAFRGTELTKLNDLLTDVAQFVYTPPQYTLGHDFFIFLQKKGYPVDEIELTGHSLGGGIAQYVSVATGQPAVIFNSANMFPVTTIRSVINAKNLPKEKRHCMVSGQRCDILNVNYVGDVVSPFGAGNLGSSVTIGLAKKGVLGLGSHRIGTIVDYANKFAEIRSELNQRLQHLEKELLTLTRSHSNLDVLADITRRINSNTSHFGSADSKFVGTKLTLELSERNRNRRTIQENPYLASGSTIVEAPADIVLNWGARPADLDSHLTGPLNANGSTFHTYFENRGSLNSSPNVLLYRDDTSHHTGGANHPEQTRINVTQPGKYNFYVHDFSNKDRANSTALSESRAVVTLHSAGNRDLPEGDNLGRQVARFEVPTNRVGTVWHTFELDTRRNTIREIKDNNFYNAREPASVPKK